MPAGSAGEQGSTERLLRARGAAARSAGPPAGSNQSGDDTDDDVPDDSQSPLFVWLSMLVRTVLSAFHTAFSALLFALYPIYVIVPSFVLEGLFKAVRRAGACASSPTGSRPRLPSPASRPPGSPGCAPRSRGASCGAAAAPPPPLPTLRRRASPAPLACVPRCSAWATSSISRPSAGGSTCAASARTSPRTASRRRRRSSPPPPSSRRAAPLAPSLPPSLPRPHHTHVFSPTRARPASLAPGSPPPALSSRRLPGAHHG